MKYEGVKNIIRGVSRKIVEAGSHTKTRGYYEYHEQYEHFFRCIGFLGRNAIEGDFFEYGVADGSSILMLDEIANELLKRREKMSARIFGFDSFEGLPEATGIDKDHHVNGSGPGAKFNKGGYGCSLERVQNKLNKRIGNTDHISLIKGWYDETLTDDLKSSLQIRKASFINIDCDFYESTKIALEWCKSILQQGTIISFDDWYLYKGSPEHGEIRAFDEFLKENPTLSATPYSQYSWHGQSFIINCPDTDL